MDKRRLAAIKEREEAANKAYGTTSYEWKKHVETVASAATKERNAASKAESDFAKALKASRKYGGRKRKTYRKKSIRKTRKYKNKNKKY